MAHMVEAIRVQWADVDAGGGAHHSLASRWAEQVEHALLRSLGVAPHRFPRRRIDVEFHRPLRFGDCFDLALRIERVGRTSVVYCWAAVREDVVHFSGRTVVVHVDEGGRPRPVPAELRRLASAAAPHGET